jgi:hypothetical protein
LCKVNPPMKRALKDLIDAMFLVIFTGLLIALAVVGYHIIAE